MSPDAVAGIRSLSRGRVRLRSQSSDSVEMDRKFHAQPVTSAADQRAEAKRRWKREAQVKELIVGLGGRFSAGGAPTYLPSQLKSIKPYKEEDPDKSTANNSVAHFGSKKLEMLKSEITQMMTPTQRLSYSVADLDIRRTNELHKAVRAGELKSERKAWTKCKVSTAESPSIGGVHRDQDALLKRLRKRAAIAARTSASLSSMTRLETPLAGKGDDAARAARIAASMNVEQEIPRISSTGSFAAWQYRISNMIERGDLEVPSGRLPKRVRILLRSAPAKRRATSTAA